MFRIRQCICLVPKVIRRTKWTETFSKVKESNRHLISELFGKHLFWTNTLTSGLLLLVGDFIEQEIEIWQQKTNKQYDYGRSTRMCMVGVTLGPLQHYFYQHLHRFFPQKILSTVVKKILIDQCVMAPTFIVLFFYIVGLFEFKTSGECTAELKEKYWDVYLTDICVWPAAQFINFIFLPLKYQVLYINVVTMFYNTLLSEIKHN